MWEEMKVFVKNWEGSVPQSVAMTAVKNSYNALHLWLLTAYEISWDFIQYFRKYRENDISSVFIPAVVTHLHIKMTAYISQISQL